MTSRHLCLAMGLAASVLLTPFAACIGRGSDSAGGDTGPQECVSELSGEDCQPEFLHEYTCDNCEQGMYCTHPSSTSSRTVWQHTSWPCECIGDDGHIIKSEDCQMTW